MTQKVGLARKTAKSGVVGEASLETIFQGGRNHFINSNFDFWQRGTSFNTPGSGQYTADRFVNEHDGTIGTFTVSRQAFTLGQTEVPHEPKYFYRWNHTAAGSGSTVRRIVQRIESVRTLAGKPVVISFWAKADTARNVNLGVRQSFGTGGSPSAFTENTAVATLALTTAWQKFTVKYDVPSIAGKTLGSNNDDYLAVQWNLPVNVTMTIDLAQVVINEGAEAAPWSYSGSNPYSEFLICQRYYQEGIAAALSEASSDPTATARDIGVTVNFGMTMRATPTVDVTEGLGGDTNLQSAATQSIQPTGFMFYIVRNAAGGYSARRKYKANAEL